jgi:dipeptidyl aminopeptidase/acylaminoacyl peptidase
LLCVLFASLWLTPAQAEIIPVDPGQPPVTQLSQAEAQKVAAIQNVAGYAFLSPISPDDQVLLAAVGNKIGFFNIQDGSLTPVNFTDPELLSGFTAPVWANNQTLVYIAVSKNVPVVVAIDRSGTVKTSPVRLPGFPIAFSPNASRLLVVIQTGPLQGQLSGDAGLPAELQNPFTQVIKRSFGDGPDGLDKLKPQNLSFAPNPLTVAVIDVNAGTLTNLYDIPENSGFSSVAWSPDSSKVAIVRNTVYLTGSQATRGLLRVSDVSTRDALGLFPPDQNPFLIGNVVDVVDFSNGAKASPALYKGNSGTLDLFAGAAWSPDNKLLTVMARPSRLAGRPNPVYLIPESSYLRFYGADGQLLGNYDNNDINLAAGYIFPDFVGPDEVLLFGARTSNLVVYYYNRATGEFRQLPVNPGTIFNAISTSSQTRQTVFLYSSFTQAPELYRINWDGSGLTPLTSLNAEATKNFAVRADPVSFTLASGEQRDGYLLQPAGASFPPQNVPLIFWQEGGPTGPMINFWAGSVENPYNLLTNFGFAILFVPLEGRFGFGPARLNALADNRNFGQIDIGHGAEIVQQAVSRGWTSPGKIGITGCSYGGYFTSQSITSYPNLYNAANTQCTLLDLFHEFQFGYTDYISYLMGRTPLSDPDEYSKDSPVFNATKIKAPTLIFAGINDFLPQHISVNFHDQLQSQGLPVNMLRFNREGHGLRIPQNQLIAAQAQISWFRQYIGGGNPAPADVPQQAQTTSFKR